MKMRFVELDGLEIAAVYSGDEMFKCRLLLPIEKSTPDDLKSVYPDVALSEENFTLTARGLARGKEARPPIELGEEPGHVDNMPPYLDIYDHRLKLRDELVGKVEALQRDDLGEFVGCMEGG